MRLSLAASAADRRLLPEGRLAGPMPWVIAIMTFLTILAAAAGLGLGAAADGLGQQLAGRLTIQIVEANPDTREAQARAVVAKLSGTAGVSAVQRVDEARMRELLAPWLGADGLDADLPVPALIDVEVLGGANAMTRIASLVRGIAPSARVDPHAQWLGPLEALLGTLRLLALALVLLMATATSAAVVLASRSALNTHRATIDVMHLMGATDVQIARLFQRRAALDALFGSLIGLLAGGIVIVLVGNRASAVGTALLDQAGLGWQSWFVIGLIPLFGVALAVLTARFTVVRALARML